MSVTRKKTSNACKLEKLTSSKDC